MIELIKSYFEEINQVLITLLKDPRFKTDADAFFALERVLADTMLRIKYMEPSAWERISDLVNKTPTIQ